MAEPETGLLQGRIPYISGGTGSRHAVVLFGANALFRALDKVSNLARYAAQVGRLLPGDHRFTIIGYEEAPPAGCTLDTIADDIALAMRAFGAEAVPVVGISFGGFVAQRLAARHSDLIRRLILLVSAHRFSDAGWQRMGCQFDALRAGDFDQLVRDNALLFRRPWFNWLVQLKLWKDRNRLAAEFNDPDVILRTYQSVFSADFARDAEAARRIEAPTFVIGAAADQYFDVQSIRETAQLISGAQLKLFDRETHMLPIERSGDVRREIAAFLS